MPTLSRTHLKPTIAPQCEHFLSFFSPPPSGFLPLNPTSFFMGYCGYIIELQLRFYSKTSRLRTLLSNFSSFCADDSLFHQHAEVVPSCAPKQRWEDSRALSSVYLPVKRLSFVVNCPEIFLITFIIAASSSLMNELEEVIFFLVLLSRSHFHRLPREPRLSITFI